MEWSIGQGRPAHMRYDLGPAFLVSYVSPAWMALVGRARVRAKLGLSDSNCQFVVVEVSSLKPLVK